MKRMIALRDAYGEALAELGGRDARVVVLEADVGSSSKSIVFGRQFPDRYFNVGIAELNMTAMAAGFAAGGCIPFVNTFATFLTTRALDPIQSLIAYDALNVKLAGAYSGLSDAYDGASHHAIADLSAVCALPGITVLSPCDAVQTRWAVFAAAEISGPVYLRLSRAEAPVLYSEGTAFTVGKGSLLRTGAHVTLVATGTMVSRALEAAQSLALDGIEADVIDMHTVRPLDSALLCERAASTRAVVVCEEHSVHGGLGALCAQTLGEQCPTPFAFAGVRSFAESGAYGALLQKYALDAPAIAREARALLERRTP